MNFMELSLTDGIILAFAGLLVGFINTMAGGGSVISISLLLFMGLPADVANGTNRIAILMQNIGSVSGFKKEKVLDFRKGIRLALPALAGSIIGAFIAADVDKKVIEIAFAFVMVLMVLMMFYKPNRWLKGQEELMNRPISWKQMLMFFFIGIYGGFIQMGIGYLLLAGLVLNAGYDLVRANALKVLIVLIYSPVAVLIFAWHGDINIWYGLVLGIGTIIGGWFSSRLAVKKGASFVRWIVAAVVVLTILKTFGILQL